MSKISFLSFKYGSSNSRNSSSFPTPISPPKENTPRTKSYAQVNFQPNMAELKKVFNKFDKNKDGKISREEYKLAVRALGVGNVEKEAAKAFQVMDSDGDGFIDFKEFVKVNSSDADGREGVNSTSDVQNAFRMFDLDGDGKISAEELWEVMKKIGEKCSLDSCRKMVRGVDKDGDGLVDINEFLGMMTRNNLKLCEGFSWF